MKILLVDDVDVIRSEVRLVLEEYKSVTSILEASNGEEAIRVVIKETPDIIILDLEMPRMGGFTFLRWLIQNKPLPVIIFSSLNSDQHIFKALNMGAVDFIAKPKTYIDDDFKEKFFQKLVAASEAKIVKEGKRVVKQAIHVKPCSSEAKNEITYLLIGASTGGPTAVQEVLQSIDKYLEIPVFIAQHMPPLFTKVFAERLNSLLEYKVKEAEDEELIRKNTVYISPGSMHMELNGKRIKLTKALKSDIHSPSVDKLFHSASKQDFKKCIAVVLTGMGNDGKEGIKALKNKGAITIAESALTCVVYGMPKEAKATGCIDFDLARDLIGSKIIEIIES